jgi:hypothetical protein
VARGGLAGKPYRSGLTWRQGIGHEGDRDQRRRLGAEHKGLRVRDLAVGSSQLPWAHLKLAANPGLVKGLVGLDRDLVYSRGARSSFDRPIRKPGTVAPSVARRRGGGGGERPAGSIGRRPTAMRNAANRAGSTGVAAPSVGARPKPTRPTQPCRTSHARVRSSHARASAQPTIRDFFAATVRGVKSTSPPRSGARAGGFVAPPAIRRCGA